MMASGQGGMVTFDDHRESYREREARAAWAKTLAYFSRDLR